MSDKTIDEVTPDTNITGVEKLPVSDAGVPKSVTVDGVKDFVLAKIVALASASGIDTSTDSIYIRQNGSIKPISAETLSSEVVAYAFGSETVSTLSATDEIVLSRSDAAKTTTISDLAAYVKDAIELDAFDIHGLTDSAQTLSDGDETPVGQEANSAWSTVKTTLGALKTFVLGGIPSFANDSSAAMTSDDKILAVDATSGNVKKVSLSDSGIGAGNVVGPSSNTDGKVPQWDGTNAKTLKDGLSVVSSVTSGSSSTEIPTAAAVWGLAGGKASAPSTNTDGHVPQWDGANSKTLKNGLGVSTSIGESPTNGSLATEKAVADKIYADISAALATGVSPGAITIAIANAITNAMESGGAIRTEIDACAKAPSSTSSGFVPQWGSSKSLVSGKQLVLSVGSSSTDDQIPTAKAVNTAIAGSDTTNLVKMTNSTTQGQIPKWSSTSKTFDNSGYSVSSLISGYGSNSELATTQAIVSLANEAAKKAVTVGSSYPSSSGHQSGEMYYCTSGDSSVKGLYINTGSYSSATWVRIATPIA